MTVLRWAVVGTGTVSEMAVSDLRLVGDVDVVAVHSRKRDAARRFAERFGIPAFTDDLDELLRDPVVDVVYLATPFATHHRMARQALEAGKHVLVEKPIAACRGEAEELFAVAARRGVFLMEAMWMKFTPGFLAMMRLIGEGRIGEVRSMRASFGVPMPVGSGSRWDLSRSGSTLLDQGIYPVTLAHALFGSPRRVTATGEVREDGLDFAEHFLLEFEGGRVASGASDMRAYADPSGSVSGSAGWIDIPALFWCFVRLRPHFGEPPGIFADPTPMEFPQEGFGLAPMFREVAGAIGAGLTEHPAHDAGATLAVFGTLDEILRQVRAGAARARSDNRC